MRIGREVQRIPDHVSPPQARGLALALYLYRRHFASLQKVASLVVYRADALPRTLRERAQGPALYAPPTSWGVSGQCIVRATHDASTSVRV